MRCGPLGDINRQACAVTMADREENDQSCSGNQPSDQPFFKAIECPDDHAKFPRT
jgi:hypothetical protein